ncbi:MAG: hypothetical protein KA383_04835 [Phycisphaerae bacterium]|nr:hypothetical protein [Phycisphaerae bacterium]
MLWRSLSLDIHTSPPAASRRSPSVVRALSGVIAAGTLTLLAGCPGTPPDDGPVFNNPEDPTNGGASYIGAAACSACHPDIDAATRLHGHASALKRSEGAAPSYPTDATRAGVPSPPDGYAWTDVSYVIGGHAKGAIFVDRDGYVLTDGVAGVNTQWNLDLPPNGTSAGFAEYLPAQATLLPFAYDCFRCHTVNPQPQTADDPRTQDGRPGIGGTWSEPGVMCEACHGPGSKHAPDPEARTMFVDSSAALCARCHTAGDDPDVILAADGYVNPNTQYAELRASGGHADFACGYCHDPHASTAYARATGVRNGCVGCHADQNLAFHDGFTFVRGDYVEALTCESCHMPFTGRSNSVAGADVVGTRDPGRMGDVRGHIFRIDTQAPRYTQMFTPDGTQVIKDEKGHAGVSLDFVCLRCHNGIGNAFVISSDGAAVIATQMHQNAAASASE